MPSQQPPPLPEDAQLVAVPYPPPFPGRRIRGSSSSTGSALVIDDDDDEEENERNNNNNIRSSNNSSNHNKKKNVASMKPVVLHEEERRPLKRRAVEDATASSSSSSLKLPPVVMAVAMAAAAAATTNASMDHQQSNPTARPYAASTETKTTKTTATSNAQATSTVTERGAVATRVDDQAVAVQSNDGKGKNSSNSNNNNSNNNNNKTKNDTNADDTRTSQDYYFDSYAHHAIHEEMLKDHVRTQTYQTAITQNAHLFRDKVVLDVGCGTAILSLFCAQVGAKHVYAVDCSSIVQQAKKIVQHNGYADKITLIQGKVEEIELPVDTVDIIVSEWMGYFLLYESMLDTVLFARDKWLVKDGTGIIFPDKAVMYLSAMEDETVRRDRIDFWDDVYGFDMSPIKEIALREPVVDVVDPKALVTDAVPILHLDILTCTKQDLAFSSDFKLQARRNDYIHGLVAYFECAFTQIHKPIGFSTAPFCRYTHWKQTMFYVPDTLTICAGETLQGQITCRPNERNKRDLDIAIAYQFQGKHSSVDTTVEYRLR